MNISFIDLKAQRAQIANDIDAAVARVIENGQFIMGPEVAKFETELARFGQAKHAIGCANGTDAIALPLMAWDIKAGDAVFCPSFTFAATAEVIPWSSATPVFVDVSEDTFNLDPGRLEAAIKAIASGSHLKPKAVIAVDLFGQAADYPAISRICREHGLKLIADSAQGFGCTLDGRHPLSWADCTTTSFFPAKPLGCYGDGGAVLTNDTALADLIESLRVHGKATKTDIERTRFEHDPKYLNVRVGMNSRLDTIQAAILIEKLSIFPREIDLRMRAAERYRKLLTPLACTPPVLAPNSVSTWAQYTIQHADRDGLAAHLKQRGVPTAVYYPIPIHMQPAYAHFPTGPGGLPVTESLARRVISLPMHPYLDEETQARIAEAISSFPQHGVAR